MIEILAQNIFTSIPGDSIRQVYHVDYEDKDAVDRMIDKFYEWLDYRFEGFNPECIIVNPLT